MQKKYVIGIIDMNYCRKEKNITITLQVNQNDYHTDPHIFTHMSANRESDSCNDDEVLSRITISHSLYTISKGTPKMSTQHDSRFSCSVYHGLRRVCSRYVNTFIFLSVCTIFMYLNILYLSNSVYCICMFKHTVFL